MLDKAKILRADWGMAASRGQWNYDPKNTAVSWGSVKFSFDEATKELVVSAMQNKGFEAGRDQKQTLCKTLQDFMPPQLAIKATESLLGPIMQRPR